MFFWCDMMLLSSNTLVHNNTPETWNNRRATPWQPRQPSKHALPVSFAWKNNSHFLQKLFWKCEMWNRTYMQCDLQTLVGRSKRWYFLERSPCGGSGQLFGNFQRSYSKNTKGLWISILLTDGLRDKGTLKMHAITINRIKEDGGIFNRPINTLCILSVMQFLFYKCHKAQVIMLAK